ncbi:MAG TPA: hypothetical protein VJ828_00115 [Lacipirellulaceae bacterium]|nr:hypothetical protein [Lacipirellulaceae bacterium]
MRSGPKTRNLSLAVLISISATNVAVSQTDVDFVPTGPADWNTNANWDPADNGGFVPEASLNENAIIGSGRTAFVDDMPPDVGGITINSGALEIRSGGNLSALPDTSVTGNLAVNGTGTLSVRRGGSLSVQNIATAAQSEVTVGEVGGTGTASLQVTGGTLGGRTRIVGPNSNLASSGPLTFSPTSVLQPVITGSTHSTITASGPVQAGGAIRPEFSGFSPALGNAWNIVTGGSLSGEFALDTSLAPVAPRGVDFEVVHTNSTATLRYINKLILQINRGTGAATITNVVGSPITFDAYTITSATGALSGAWNSLDDQSISAWEQADNTSAMRLTEFNPSGTSVVNVGGSLPLGTPFNPPAPNQFGEAVGEDLRFEYGTPAAGAAPALIVDGIVEYVGGHNNLVLTIDPATGRAAIQNESPYFDVAIDAYTIESANGRLRFADGQWNSLDDQNLSTWEQADNVNASRVTEFNRAESTPLPGGGTILNLGALVDVSGAPLRDDEFSFSFSLVGGGVDGDFNNDGIVDAADYVVWRKTIGSQTAYDAWRANFGSTGDTGTGRTLEGIVVLGPLPTGTGLAASASVPEPGTLAGCILIVSLIAIPRRSTHVRSPRTS